ncbi:MAG: hypothetical protein ACJAWS_002306, partial [Oleiphilaceae bacterium]
EGKCDETEKIHVVTWFIYFMTGSDNKE